MSGNLWIPACAGMTEGMTGASVDEALNLSLTGAHKRAPISRWERGEILNPQIESGAGRVPDLHRGRQDDM